MVLQTAFVFIGACSGGGVTDTPPLVGPDTTTTGGVVQRTSLTVLVAINPEDVAWASQAGVSTTGVTVRLAKSGEIGAEASAVTNGTGQVRFQQLLEGLYHVSVERTLTPAEVAKLVPTDRDRSLLAAGTQVVISPPTPRTIEVGLVASRRGSLVISEVYGHSPFVVNSTYGWAQ